MGLSQEDSHWDFYVSCRCRRSGIETRMRCAGLQTALAYARQRQELGFFDVKVLTRKHDRHKERLPRVLDSSLYGFHQCSGDGY